MGADWWNARKNRVSITLWEQKIFPRELRGFNRNFSIKF